jgi:hypothetical protein
LCLWFRPSLRRSKLLKIGLRFSPGFGLWLRRGLFYPAARRPNLGRQGDHGDDQGDGSETQG